MTQIAYLDEVNKLVRGPKSPALMPRVTSGAGVGVGTGIDRGLGGRGSPAGRGGPKGLLRPQQEGNGDDGISSTAYDPLTGEALEANGDAQDSNTEKVMATVSPKCEDKVDYDIMVDLVDYIMRTEAGEAVVPGAGVGAGYGGRGSSSNSRNRGGGRGGAGGGGRGRSGRASAVRAGDGGNGEPLGAILVFLPGFAEIDQLVKALQRHPRIGKGARIFPLHSSLPPHQQKSIFQRMPEGVRKIVVSTNIAETSVSLVRCALENSVASFWRSALVGRGPAEKNSFVTLNWYHACTRKGSSLYAGNIHCVGLVSSRVSFCLGYVSFCWRCRR